MLTFYGKLKRDYLVDLKFNIVELGRQYIYAYSYGYECKAKEALSKLKEALGAMYVLENYDLFAENTDCNCS